MKKIEWPAETSNYAYYKCAICDNIIENEKNMDQLGNIYLTPKSRYWNPELNEIYCSAKHSFERYLQCIQFSKACDGFDKEHSIK